MPFQPPIYCDAATRLINPQARAGASSRLTLPPVSATNLPRRNCSRSPFMAAGKEFGFAESQLHTRVPQEGTPLLSWALALAEPHPCHPWLATNGIPLYGILFCDAETVRSSW